MHGLIKQQQFPLEGAGTLQPTHHSSAKKQLKLKHDHDPVQGHQDWPPDEEHVGIHKPCHMPESQNTADLRARQ